MQKVNIFISIHEGVFGRQPSKREMKQLLYFIFKLFLQKKKNHCRIEDFPFRRRNLHIEKKEGKKKKESPIELMNQSKVTLLYTVQSKIISAPVF
jgi:hypothetical protein